MPDSPPVRHFEFSVPIVGDDPECIALLVQVMNSYPHANRAAVAAWFSKAYGIPEPPDFPHLMPHLDTVPRK